MPDIAGFYVALAEGLGLALSPCILPVLPFILAAATGTSRLRPFLIIGGFIASFTAFALVSRHILAALSISQEVVQTGSYVLLLLFGLVMVVPFLEERFARLTGRLADKAQNATRPANTDTLWGGVIVGALIGVVWTPCAGPILAAALLQVIQASNGLDAAMTIFAFAIGAGIPMLLIALFGQYLTGYVRALARHATMVRRVMGVLIILFAGFGLSGFNIGTWVALKESQLGIGKSSSVEAEATSFAAYPAPALAEGATWLNSAPLKISDLKGKVVLIDFWTYSCINCIRTLPHITSWYEAYKDKGFVVIGVHAPEFAFEAKPENVTDAMAKFGITYPVVLDNNFVTWNNFKNQYWPAHYLINQDGQVVYTHFGEGHYDVTENKIRHLLGLNGQVKVVDDKVTDSLQTPETYLGKARAARYKSNEPQVVGAVRTYSMPSSLDLHHWALGGSWQVENEKISAQKNAKLVLHFKAAKVFLVMGNPHTKPLTTRITLNGAPIGKAAGKDVTNGIVTVTGHRLYELVDQKALQEGTLEIEALTPDIDMYAFTFGL